jgi:hypothetical protein
VAAHVLPPPTHRWYCDRCTQTDVTHEVRPHFRYHACPGYRGLSAPFILEGTKAKVEVREPEDYVGRNLPQTDADGRPVAAVVTTRDDGQDTLVLAPTLVIKAGA